MQLGGHCKWLVFKGNKPVHIIVDLIVTGERQKNPEPWAQGEEDLRGSVHPHLESN